MRILPGQRPVRFTAFLMTVATTLGPRVVQACEVCYGQASSPWIDASRAAVWLMLGVTIGVQVAFATFFVRVIRRTKTLRTRRSEMGLVGGKGAG